MMTSTGLIAPGWDFTMQSVLIKILREEFEGRSADELNNNELIRQFYLGA